MERVNMMREKRGASSVDLIKLLKRIDNYSDILVCVFEGEDAKYYGSRIDGVFTNLERKNLNCKGKSNVISLRDKVKANKELSKAKVLYFVDADFDGDCNEHDIYCTPCYSIENLYAQVNVFKKILTDEFGLCSFKDEGLINSLCSEYELFENKADDALLELNAWIWHRKEQSETHEGIKLNLNNIRLDKFLDFSDDGPMQNYTIETLDRLFEINVSIDSDRYETIKHNLSSKDLKIVTRGKYRLEYFRVHLSSVVDSARKGENLFANNKKNPKITLSRTQILSELTQYAVTPGCLVRFLERNSSTMAA